MIARIATKASAHRLRWWRRCVAWCALVALAWPSLGPLPYVIHGFGAHVHAAAHAGGAHRDADHRHAASHDDDGEIDASAIPGSPLHPADHNCAECDVLKHLSRSAPASKIVVLAAPALVAVAAPAISVAAPAATPPAHLPPVRAPPQAIA